MIKKVESSEPKYYDGYGHELRVPKSGYSRWYNSEYMPKFKFRYNFKDKVLECYLGEEFTDSIGLSIGNFLDGPQYWVDKYGEDLKEETDGYIENLKSEMPELFVKESKKPKTESLRIIKKRTPVTKTTYSRDFEYDYEKGCGFTFPCDEKGNILPGLQQAAKDNYKQCISGTVPHLKDIGVREHTQSYTEPAEGKCHCGNIVYLEPNGSYHGAIECDNCGQWYNLNGEELNPPSQWEEPIDYDY